MYRVQSDLCVLSSNRPKDGNKKITLCDMKKNTMGAGGNVEKMLTISFKSKNQVFILKTKAILP